MVEFSNREELELWLSGKPAEWSAVIAARSALRVVPMLATAHGPRRRDNAQVGSNVVLQVFRGMAAPWFVGAWLNRGADARAAARAAARASNRAARLVGYAATTTARTARAAEYAAVTAGAAGSKVYPAADYKAYAASAVDTAADAAETATDIWAAASFDATALEGGATFKALPNELGTQPLWPEAKTPKWAGDNWVELKRTLLGADEGWDVWTGWYESHLHGRPANEQFGLARVPIADEIWQQGPKIVNAHIKRLIEDSEIFTTSDEVLSPIEPVPAQGPGPQFRANEDGLVDRAPPADVDADGNDVRTINQLRPLVLRCAADLQARLSRNEFPELLDATKNYQSALDLRDGEIEWGEVWGLGVLLQNAATSAERQIENRTLPALEDPAKTALDSLLTLHGPLVLASQDGARLSESSAHFAMTREQQQALREAAQQIVERLNASPDVVTPRAAASLSAATDTIGQGRHPERGSIYGLATIKNISIALIGGAAVATPAVIGALLGTVFDAATIGTVIGAPFSLVAVEAVKKNPAFIALVTQLGAKLETMTDIELGAWLEGKARRLAPLRSFVSKNQAPLRQIAATTPELKWMLKYIDFIVAETGVAGEVAKEAKAISQPAEKPSGGFGSGGFGEGPFGG